MKTSSMFWPMPDNPLVLKWKGHVPSMKNNREVRQQGNRRYTVVSSDVTKKIQENRDSLLGQWEVSRFDRVPHPNLVSGVVELYWSVKAANALPKSDDDNAITTLQEILQPPGVGIGFLNIVDDDVQVRGLVADPIFVDQKAKERAVMYLWVRPRDSRLEDSLIQFFAWRKAFNELGDTLPTLPAGLDQSFF